jgi:UDP-N-acetylglucosamine--N-acetylmuramyl-(pentapeptide) pyrophosphoryl-undecaprenol N-acetylglucosamine transferase
MKVIITGGGTSGHVIPAIEVANAIRERDPNVEFLWIGSHVGMEKDLVPKFNIPFVAVSTGKIRRYFSLKNISDLIKIPFGILQAGRILANFKPQVVFSKGGFASIPTVIAAWMQNIPILTHESDIVPGLANKKLSWFTTKVALSFPDRRNYFDPSKAFVSGFPVRKDALNGDKQRALDMCNFADPAKPVLFITGGSQGAVRINNAILPIISELVKKFNIIHQCGSFQYEELKPQVEGFVNEGSYRIFPYIQNEMPDVLKAADVVVSRAGSTIFELAMLHKRMLLIPLEESANNHQHENAVYFSESGLARVLVEKNLKSHILYKNILDLFYQVDEEKISEAAQKVIHENAASDMADWVLKLSNYGKNKI